jgi:hypothetical protein
MNQTMRFPKDVEKMIKRGKRLLLAGDEKLLATLPHGNWIGGTTHYFMTNEGAITSTEKIMVTELPDFCCSVKLSSYNEDTIQNVYTDGFKGGISFIIIPSLSKLHFSFALNAPSYANFATIPVVGWLSAISLSDSSNRLAKTFLGAEGLMSYESAVVMHVELPKNRYAHVEVVNGFVQGDGDLIEFVEDGFNAQDAIINGVKQNFSDYLLKQGLIVQLPLVADYCGTMVNVSIQSIDRSRGGNVTFYAPVFKNIKYKLAMPVVKHPHELLSKLKARDINSVVFSCNCILNYMVLNEKQKGASRIVGPVTFGEIAYQLLNQTFLFVKINKLTD